MHDSNDLSKDYDFMGWKSHFEFDYYYGGMRSNPVRLEHSNCMMYVVHGLEKEYINENEDEK
jgi:hypothetical protein